MKSHLDVTSLPAQRHHDQTRACTLNWDLLDEAIPGIVRVKAAALGITRKHLSDWKNGQPVNTSLPEARRMAATATQHLQRRTGSRSVISVDDLFPANSLAEVA